ncbi:MAG: outer membrane protein assembly factor BamA, partial [Novosphingobium sp.]|nr:outer membrane protein assembly factor BamA [Novosphingobium sp.]
MSKIQTIIKNCLNLSATIGLTFLLNNMVFSNLYTMINPSLSPSTISVAQALGASAIAAVTGSLVNKTVDTKSSYDTENNIPNNNINNKLDNKKIIKDIMIFGNKSISTDTILIKIPYRPGQPFDPTLTSQLIRNIYSLKYFDSIEVKVENIDEQHVNLIVILSEKKKLESITYQGNSNLTEEEIEKKYKFSDIPTINQEEANLLAEQIRKLYQEKNFNNVNIIPVLEKTKYDTLMLKFDIQEGKKVIIKKIEFHGNHAFTGKKLRSLMFTREDWILGALDRAGSYDPNMLEKDKQILEYFYQSNGYFKAHVKDVKINLDPKTNYMNLDFIIEEGELYKINDVQVDTHDKIQKEILLAALPIKPGQIYNRDLLRQSMEVLRTIWGQYGYAYADVTPIPVPDFQEKTIDISFQTDLGNQMFIDRINIIGNYKTRDNVIRRTLAIQEGELLTTQAMDISKARVESLGFFDPHEGVDWKVNKISDNLAELNLMVKEIRTGKLYGQLGFGGADDKSALKGLKITAGISDRNLMGMGIKYSLNCSFSQEDRGILFNIYQPYLFNKPIGAGFDAYIRNSLYDQFQHVADIPVENVTGFIGNISFNPIYIPDLSTIFNAGIENIQYTNKVIAEVPGRNPEEKELFQSILNRRF